MAIHSNNYWLASMAAGSGTHSDNYWLQQIATGGGTTSNVKNYGAKGDGTTDDTAAIQRALDQTPNNVVFLPKGTYVVDPTTGISLDVGQALIGEGMYNTIIKVKGVNAIGNVIKAESKDGILLSDFAIDGNKAALSDDQAVSTNYGVYLADSDHSRVQRVRAFNTTGVGIHVYNSIDVTVTDCISTGNQYHGYESEQTSYALWQGNAGYSNLRHGIFISPGEVGGTGSIGNVIDGNSFYTNGQYGIAYGIDAGGLSVGLTRDNSVTNNTIRANTGYGISIYRVNDVTVANNLVIENGMMGIYLYRAERNQILGNRLHNNSATTNGAYDEILLEGNGDGQASQHNNISNNFIQIDGTNKANYGIREATSGDGPNLIKNNYIPTAGVTGRVLIQHANTAYETIDDTPANRKASLTTFDKGVAIGANATLPGGTMGFDAPFGTAVVRLFNDNSGGNVQIVTPNGGIDMYAGGNNNLSVTSAKAIAQKLRLQSPTVPANASASGESGDIAWDSGFVYVCTATNTWKRSAIATW